MKKAEFQRAVEIAKSQEEITEDDSHLYGCALPGFQPVFTSLKALAKLLRWQCLQLNGQWDEQALNEMWKIARYRFESIV